jgi:hypothetical protein
MKNCILKICKLDSYIHIKLGRSYKLKISTRPCRRIGGVEE